MSFALRYDYILEFFYSYRQLNDPRRRGREIQIATAATAAGGFGPRACWQVWSLSQKTDTVFTVENMKMKLDLVKIIQIFTGSHFRHSKKLVSKKTLIVGAKFPKHLTNRQWRQIPKNTPKSKLKQNLHAKFNFFQKLLALVELIDETEITSWQW